MADSVQSGWQRGSAADLWRHTLSQIHCVFGRLVYLSSLRNGNTGRYEHHGLALVFGEEEADRTLRRSHEEAFAEWLGFNLEQQKADLDLYFSEQGTDRKTIVETWMRLASYRNLLPSSAEAVQRELYLADLETILSLLKNEYGVAGPGPVA
jgi:hypothetical protein